MCPAARALRSPRYPYCPFAPGSPRANERNLDTATPDNPAPDRLPVNARHIRRALDDFLAAQQPAHAAHPHPRGRKACSCSSPWAGRTATSAVRACRGRAASPRRPPAGITRTALDLSQCRFLGQRRRHEIDLAALHRERPAAGQARLRARRGPGSRHVRWPPDRRRSRRRRGPCAPTEPGGGEPGRPSRARHRAGSRRCSRSRTRAAQTGSGTPSTSRWPPLAAIAYAAGSPSWTRWYCSGCGW